MAHPSINLAALSRAAVINPMNGKQTDPANVVPFQYALAFMGKLPWGLVNGVYDSHTHYACTLAQLQFGFTGNGADGLPGPLTLEKLQAWTDVFTYIPPAPPAPPAGGREQAISINSVTYDLVDDESVSGFIIPKILDLKGIVDPAARRRWTNGFLTMGSRESGYNLNAINNYDSNAHGPIQADGYPLYCSRGWAQCIPPTFASHHEPGTTDDIYDGVANGCASLNYVMDNYGVFLDGSNLASNVQQFDPNRPSAGY